MTILSARPSRVPVKINTTFYVDMSELVTDWDNFEADFLDSDEFSFFETSAGLIWSDCFYSKSEGRFVSEIFVDLVKILCKCSVFEAYVFDRENQIFKVQLGMCKIFCDLFGVEYNDITEFIEDGPYELAYEDDLRRELAKLEKLLKEIERVIEILKTKGPEYCKARLQMFYFSNLVKHEVYLVQSACRRALVTKLVV